MTMKPPKPKLNRQILDEASEWFVDFRVGDVDSQARERFDLWLRQSPEHIRAYMEIAKTYVVLPTLNPERKIDVQELIAYARSEGNVIPLEQTPRPNEPLSRLAEPHLSAPARKRGALWARRYALAASIAIVCLTAGLLAWLALQRYPTYATDIGERRTVTLADGSTIDLNARSKVRVKFSKAERDVELVDGQALFEVAKDQARPFIVRSGAAVVRAVGTQFDVNRKRSGTTVTVIEGRVAVYSSNPNPPAIPSPPVTEEKVAAKLTGEVSSGTPAVFVSAGEQVTIADHQVAQPKRADVVATTAWTQHRLVFDGSRLSDVVDEFNRYNTRQIVIDDRQLEDFHISGVYSSTDPASLIRFLREQQGIEVFETDEGVRVTRK
jgi:transmembrane sensor